MSTLQNLTFYDNIHCYGAEFKLDVGLYQLVSAGRLLSVIWQTFVDANIVSRAKAFVANVANAFVPQLSFATAGLN